jgi:PadR family transcriptional regulator PadR
VLNTLSEKDRYGYEILEIIAQNSVSHYEIKQSTLYSILKRLENLEYISSYDGLETNGAQRKYYTLTDKGRSFLETQKYEWEYTRTLLDKLVSNKPVDLIDSLSTFPYNPNDLKPKTPRKSKLQGQQEYDDNINMQQDAKDMNNNIDLSTETTSFNINQTLESDMSFKNQRENNQSPSMEEQLERERAEKLLGLGVYLPLESTDVSNKNADDINVQPTLSTIGVAENSIINATPSLNYREALGLLYTDDNSLFHDGEITNEANEEALYIKAENSRFPHYNDMKKRLFDEGYTVKTYNKANSSNFYYMNYYYSNKLFRDLTLIVYIFYATLLTILSFLPEALQLSRPSFLSALGIGLIVPTVRLLIYLQNPLKRIRAKFNALKIILYFTLWMTFSVLIIFLINLINDTICDSLYLVFILYSSIPFAMLIYYLMFRSNKYHLKK